MSAPRFRQRRELRPGDVATQRDVRPTIEPEVQLGEGEFEAPPAMERFSGPAQDDLTGRVRGDITVMGAASGKRMGRRGVLWVVRCVCGIYGMRRTQSMKLAGRDACSACMHRGPL